MSVYIGVWSVSAVCCGCEEYGMGNASNCTIGFHIEVWEDNHIPSQLGGNDLTPPAIGAVFSTDGASEETSYPFIAVRTDTGLCSDLLCIQ